MGEYAVAKTSVWWDIENCCVPSSCDPQLIVHNMSSALAAAGYRGAISVSAYGDTHQIAHSVQHALSSTGVSLNHVPAGIKDARDKKILVDMLFWAIDNPPPANYLLISGDQDFSNAIHKLKMRRYNILLAQPPNVSQTLTTAAKSVWLWKSLVAGEPPLAQSPYISNTSSDNKDDSGKSKNIVSSSSGVTQDTNPEVHNILCDPQSDANGKAVKKYEVTQPREMQTDNVSKPTRLEKRSNPGGSEFTKQTSVKKSKGDFHSTEQSKLKKPKKANGLICLKCGVLGHRPFDCTYIGVCRRCCQPHMERVCKKNPESIIRWEEVPAHRPVKGQGMICLNCGIVGHRAAKCTYIGVCRHCGQGHMERMCKENPDSIIKWEQVHAYALATSSQGLVHIAAPASQLSPTRTPPPGSLWQATPVVPTPSPGPAAPALPHAGVAQQSKLKKPKKGKGLICLKCGILGHRPVDCTYIGVCRRCGQGHMERVCKKNPESIIRWEQVPAHRPIQGLGMICLNCGIVGHRAAKCTYSGACGHCGQGHMERVCKENPDSIIKWEQVHAYDLATSSQGLVHIAAPASQLSPTRTPPPVSLWQATPALPTPSSGPAAPALPHAGVAASSSPIQCGVYSKMTARSLGKPDLATQPTSLAPRPPMELLPYQSVLGQDHQVGTSQLLPAWAPPLGYFWPASPVVPSPRESPLAAPVPPQLGVAAFPRLTHPGFPPMPFPFGRPR